MAYPDIDHYYAELDDLKDYSGSKNEGTISAAFANLLQTYCRPLNYRLVQQIEFKTPLKTTIRFDGVVRDALQNDCGYWEAKDSKDHLETEIEKKRAAGYPFDNILFEDSVTAVLFQQGQEAARIEMADPEALHRLLRAFLTYERPEVAEFRRAIAIFREDLPRILKVLRETIKREERENAEFGARRDRFWEVCKQSIGPQMTQEDVHEILIQHILSEDIFLHIFGEAQFHQENNISQQVQAVVNTFFKGALRKEVRQSIEHYYAAIRNKAASISNHHDKQEFLKQVYENFYTAYNPKAADRLGIVYTPAPVVRFMIESVNYLLDRHFNKSLSDQGVKILDPATGTGTFVTDLIEYLPKRYVESKYKNDIFCNEVAVLPYYIANLNIEYTYRQKTDKFDEFKHICFVDTLEHTAYHYKQGNLLAMSVENTERIRQQNDQEITVILGNPPYNAWQENFNMRNPNRPYQGMDKRIHDTYVKEGKAQNKIALYDMYVRFYRWATDRLKNEGIIAFITNSSFLDSKTFDGFRKMIGCEFDYAYFLDLGGNVREISGRDGIYICEEHTIFGVSAMTGIAIGFLVKTGEKNQQQAAKIHYLHPFHIHELRTEKLKYLSSTKFKDIPFERVTPDKKHNWINLTDNDFDELLPLIDKNVKAGKEGQAIFKLFSRGIETGRDEWVFDYSENEVAKKCQYFVDLYNQSLKQKQQSSKIKWNSSLELSFQNKIQFKFNRNKIIKISYRLFSNKFFYSEEIMCHRLTHAHHEMFGYDLLSSNQVISITNHTQVPFLLLAIDRLSEVGLGSRTGQCLPLYRYDKNGDRHDNITDWGLHEIQQRSGDTQLTKLDIFHYIYAVLHHPAYRQKYEIDLKRDFPRLPIYANIRQWVAWGRDLMELHIHFETVAPYGLQRSDQPSDRPDDRPDPKPKLKADKSQGQIILDSETTLSGVPAIAWDYKLGNRSAIEWVLDQHKEKTPKDPTIRELFNTYRFSDHKEKVIDLCDRLCTVSVRTMEIVQQMPPAIDP